MTAPTPGAPDVAELRRLLAAGHTPLPWTVFTETQGYPDDGMLYIEEMEITLGPESYPVNVADANLIAGVSLLPALLDRLDALDAVAEAARAESMDSLWRETATALPKGWCDLAVYHYDPEPGDVHVEGHYGAKTGNPDTGQETYAYGPTPAAALSALRAALDRLPR